MVINRHRINKAISGNMVSGIAFLMISLCILSSCQNITPYGDVVINDLDLDPFDKVVVENGIATRVNVGGNESSATITCNSNVIRYLDYKVVGDALHVRYKEGYSFNNGLTLELKVNVPTITEVDASGGATVGIYNEVKGALKIVLSGGSVVRANTLNLDSLDLNISGGGGASIKGYAQNGSINCSGGSGARDYDMVIDYLSINMSGGGNSFLTVKYAISSVELSGGSIFTYKGNPTIIKTNISGDSELIKEE